MENNGLEIPILIFPHFGDLLSTFDKIRVVKPNGDIIWESKFTIKFKRFMPNMVWTPFMVIYICMEL